VGSDSHFQVTGYPEVISLFPKSWRLALLFRIGWSGSDNWPSPDHESRLGAIQHRWTIIVDIADQPVRWRHAHAVRFVRAQKVDRRPGLVAVVRPSVIVTWVQDDWHAVVDGLHQLVGLCSEDGEGVQWKVWAALARSRSGNNPAERRSELGDVIPAKTVFSETTTEKLSCIRNFR
jgi:hypothetical protein